MLPTLHSSSTQWIFCIAAGSTASAWCLSSDSDFTRLAARIREHGVDVFGFGEQKTPESFRQACRRFIYTENLLPETTTTDARAKKPLESLAHASRILKKIMAEMETDDGWMSLGQLGSLLANLAPDFDPRTYGFKKLSDLVRKMDVLDIAQSDTGHIRVRLKPVSGTPRATK